MTQKQKQEKNEIPKLEKRSCNIVLMLVPKIKGDKQGKKEKDKEIEK